MRPIHLAPILVPAALSLCCGGTLPGAPPPAAPVPEAPAPPPEAAVWVDHGDGTATATDSGLTWQTGRSDTTLKWAAATAYCAGLALAGGGWRLPGIAELRTLIRGCDGTVTGGACAVTDACPSRSCRPGTCYACQATRGPTDGCYGRPELSGACDTYWSSTVVSDDPGSTWFVSFVDGHVYAYGQGNGYYARCVRGPG